MPLLGTVASQFSGKSFGSFESIASAFGTGSSNISFNSIPSTYKNLQIRGILRDAGGGAGLGASEVTIKFNGSTGPDYNYHYLSGNGTSANIGFAGSLDNADMQVQRAGVLNGNASNLVGCFIIDIYDYASTSKKKLFKSFSGNTSNIANTAYGVAIGSGYWNSTAAITSITLNSGAGYPATISNFALYGIKG
jgi:hypothetical protein